MNRKVCALLLALASGVVSGVYAVAPEDESQNELRSEDESSVQEEESEASSTTALDAGVAGLSTAAAKIANRADQLANGAERASEALERVENAESYMRQGLVEAKKVLGPTFEHAIALHATGIVADLIEAFAIDSTSAGIHAVAAVGGIAGGVSDVMSSHLIGPSSWYNGAGRLSERVRRIAKSSAIAKAIAQLPRKKRRELRRSRNVLVLLTLIDALLRAAYVPADALSARWVAAALASMILGFVRHKKAHRQYKRLLEYASVYSAAADDYDHEKTTQHLVRQRRAELDAEQEESEGDQDPQE